MHKTVSVMVPVTEASQVGEARRAASALADAIGFDAQRRGEVGIIVTEAAGNLVQHTEGGEIVLRRVTRGAEEGLEILALDRGPGMADVGRCLGDGHSTAGTPGNGLGAIVRLSAEFDVHSAVGVGTAVWSRVWAKETAASRGPSPARAGLEVGAVCLPVRGEQECGDAWATQTVQMRNRFVVADGLGHGPLAAEASGMALALFDQSPYGDLEALVTAMHQGMRHTRGAAVAVMDLGQDDLRFVGVGNIVGAVISGEATWNMVSHNGTVGYQTHRVHEFTYPWPPGAVVVLHSDGLKSQWRLNRYPGLITRHPSLIAGVLYRDFFRGRDDVTVLVVRYEGRHEARGQTRSMNGGNPE